MVKFRNNLSDVWVSPDYLPTMGELSRARKRWLKMRSETEGTPFKTLDAMHVTCPKNAIWPAFADPDDLKQFK